MGATVVVDRNVCGFEADGEVYYFCSEQTYTKNMHPIHEDWDVIAFGKYEDVMKRIYQLAGVVEGGMLQNRPNNLTPESYLRGWQKAFKNAAKVTNHPIYIDLRRESYSGISSVNALMLKDVLEKHKLHDKWSEICHTDKGIYLNLYESVDVLVDIFGIDGFASFNNKANIYLHCTEDINNELTPKESYVELCSSTVSHQDVVKFSDGGKSFYMAVGRDGLLTQYGYEYEVIDIFINYFAYHCEMAQKGYGIKHIEQYRSYLNELPNVIDDYDAYVMKKLITPDLKKQFEYNVGVSLEDIGEVHKLESPSFALNHIYHSIPVYYQPKSGNHCKT